MFLPWELPWLPEAPDGFRERCRSFDLAAPDAGQRLATLAGHRLNSAQARAFARLLARGREAGIGLAPLAPMRLGILPASTLDLVADMLPAAAARHGVAVEIRMADSGQVVQTALDSQAGFFAEPLDAVLIELDHRWLGIDRFAAGVDDRIDARVAEIESVLDAIAAAGGGQAIVTNIACPPGALFGSLDGAVDGTIRRQVQRFNDALGRSARARGAIVMDVAALAEQVGTAHWFDPVLWHQYKLPFAADCAALFADAVGRKLGAMRGKARKCLVLDCDNTLWGGAIGDDGIEGIEIGQGSALGESFLAIQRLALDLRERGVMLAICSKNLDANARQPFRDHADMLLRESHIAVFQANWADKPSNLEAIANTLGIGVDALVFLDDNAAERAEVRAALPMVAVPELPADPAWYPLYLSSAGYFEAVAFSAEDRTRAESYAANAQRAEVLGRTRDLGDYLRALGMEIDIRPFDAIGVPRIAQLVNKSNQFNLTTRRYTESEIRAFAEDPSVVTLQVRLRDRFGDFGMIGVVIGRDAGDAIEVDSWLMSCRVLGRKVEEAMLAALVAAARAKGKARVLACYLPTAKNAMVAELFDRLGFERVREGEGGERDYALDMAGYVIPELPFV